MYMGRLRSLKIAPIDGSYTTYLVCLYNYSSILYHFRVIWRWILSRPWNL